MSRKILSLIFGSALALMFSGVGLASATVIQPGQNSISISQTHNDGHLTISVTTPAGNVVSMDPPFPGV